MFGTIARKKKSLNHLMDTIYKVCKKEITPEPKQITYNKVIEDGIESLTFKLSDFPSLPSYLLRWIALKIIDGDKKILNSIEKNFNVSTDNSTSINQIKVKILNDLNSIHIVNDGFKDSIVSSIMKRSEEICKKVCTFETKDYARKRQKNR